MPTDINVSQLIINKLTQAQFDEAKNAGNINETELYMITDDDGDVENKETFVADYGVTTCEEMAEAFSAGRTMLCREISGDYIFYYTLRYTNGSSLFQFERTIADHNSMYSVICNNAMWSQRGCSLLSTSTGGTIYGKLDVRYADTSSRVRNTSLSPTDTTPTANGEICWTYG